MEETRHFCGTLADTHFLSRADLSLLQRRLRSLKTPGVTLYFHTLHHQPPWFDWPTPDWEYLLCSCITSRLLFTSIPVDLRSCFPFVSLPSSSTLIPLPNQPPPIAHSRVFSSCRSPPPVGPPVLFLLGRAVLIIPTTT